MFYNTISIFVIIYEYHVYTNKYKTCSKNNKCIKGGINANGTWISLIQRLNKRPDENKADNSYISANKKQIYNTHIITYKSINTYIKYKTY